VEKNPQHYYDEKKKKNFRDVVLTKREEKIQEGESASCCSGREKEKPTYLFQRKRSNRKEGKSQSTQPVVGGKERLILGGKGGDVRERGGRTTRTGGKGP